MGFQVNKLKKNKIDNNQVLQNKRSDNSTFQFMDNRFQAIAQRKMQKNINNSPKLKQLKDINEMADTYIAKQEYKPIKLHQKNNLKTTGNRENLHYDSITQLSRTSKPYKHEITMQTNLVSLRIKHDDIGNKSEDEINGYKINKFEATARPTVFIDNNAQENQGQHKVAWVAIWSVLESCLNEHINDAITILGSIVNRMICQPYIRQRI